jgi:hypothetical protein
MVLSLFPSLQTIHYSSCNEQKSAFYLYARISSTFCSAVYTNMAVCMLGFQAFFSNILVTIPLDRPLLRYQQKVL